MARLIVLVLCFGCWLHSAALAGQASGGFSVGLRIGGPESAAEKSLSGKTFTWGAAAVSVRRAGFEGAAQLRKSESVYWFAARRGGAAYRVAVSALSGDIVEVLPG